MGIISTLKSILGIDGRDREEPRSTDAAVTVERDPGDATPDAETERAVKEPTASTREGPAEDADTDTEADAEPGDGAAEPPADDGDDASVETIKGIGPAYADRLRTAGVETVGDLATADAAALSEATDIAEGRIDTWIERAAER